MTYEVSNDDDAWTLLAAMQEDAEHTELDLSREGLLFVDWPTYEVVLRGVRMQGGLPIRVWPSMTKLQRAINRTYARSVYGDERKTLSKDEKSQLEVVVYLTDEYSTGLRVALGSALNKMVDGMDGIQKYRAILYIATLTAGGMGFWFYLNHLAEGRTLFFQERLSEQETRRMEIQARILDDQREFLWGTQKDLQEHYETLIKGMDDSETIVYNGVEVINGGDAKTLLRVSRKTPLSYRPIIEDDFTILRIDSGSVSVGLRARVKSVSTGEEWNALIDMPENSARQIQQAEWNKEAIYMVLQPIGRTGRIAKLRSVGD